MKAIDRIYKDKLYYEEKSWRVTTKFDNGETTIRYFKTYDDAERFTESSKRIYGRAEAYEQRFKDWVGEDLYKRLTDEN